VAEEVAEAAEVELAQRIDDEVLAGNGYLDEADLVEVGVQGVGLGVDRDDAALRDALQGAVELGLLVDPDHSATTSSRNPIDDNFRLYATRSNPASDVSAR